MLDYCIGYSVLWLSLVHENLIARTAFFRDPGRSIPDGGGGGPGVTQLFARLFCRRA